jgi:DNA-binding CsgD family transcriptional regulator
MMYQLTERENEVAELLLRGISNKQIARVLHISERTVEFHLSNIYSKIGVRSKSEAISVLWKTPGMVPELKPEKSTVDFDPDKLDNQDVKASERVNLQKMRQRGVEVLWGRFKIPIVAGILISVLLFIVVWYLDFFTPTSWEYERECEYPNESTVGQMIQRSNASFKKTHGQFGSTDGEPWAAKPGYVVYKDINTPHSSHLFLKLRYSKNSPGAISILVYLDDEIQPRVSILPIDQQNWNRFTWSEPYSLGEVESGIHSLKFLTEGQQFGVADLDKFVLLDGSQ